jgi:hypothetical protein
VIERKYVEMIDRLRAEPAPTTSMEPLPGWLQRRRKNLPPASEVLASIPSGPVIPSHA